LACLKFQGTKLAIFKHWQISRSDFYKVGNTDLEWGSERDMLTKPFGKQPAFSSFRFNTTNTILQLICHWIIAENSAKSSNLELQLFSGGTEIDRFFKSFYA